MIHLGLFLIAAVVVMSAIGGTVSAIGAAFSEGAGWGLVVTLGAVVGWIVLLAIVF